MKEHRLVNEKRQQRDSFAETLAALLPLKAI